MKAQRRLILLTIINFALLLVTLGREALPASAQQPAPMLRGRGLEIVDDKGRVRSAMTPMSFAHRTKTSNETLAARS